MTVLYVIGFNGFVVYELQKQTAMLKHLSPHLLVMAHSCKSAATAVCLLLFILAPVRIGLAGDAMWMWQNIEILDNPTNLHELVRFSEAHGIDELYVSISSSSSSSLLEPPSQQYPKWNQLITVLHQHGIRIEALAGDVDWLMPEGGWNTPANGNSSNRADRADALQVSQTVFDYNAATSEPDMRFDGLHLDVEVNFFNTPGSTFDPFGNLMTPQIQTQYFLELIDQVSSNRNATGLTQSNLPIHWDVYSDVHRGNFTGVALSWPSAGGTVKLGWKHLFDRMERITFLTYYDNPHSDQLRNVAAQMQRLLAYLDAMSPSSPTIRYGFEFQRQFGPFDLRPIGLWNEDYLTFVNLKQNYASQFYQRDYFQGFAIHAYDNRDVTHGDYRTWVPLQTPFSFPSSMDMTVSGQTNIVPTNGIESITEPVHLRLEIKAHPDYAYVDSSDFRNMISIVPVGFGYANEDQLNALTNVQDVAYDGIAPTRWWYYAHLRWWPNQSVEPYPDVVSQGVCWSNPATASNPDNGVVRELILQAGEPYRFIVLYNFSGESGEITSEFLSASILAPMASVGHGDSFDTPIPMQIYLGKTTNYNIPDQSHNIDSVVLFDSDLDGLSDGEEFVRGTNPNLPDTDSDFMSDSAEVVAGTNPLNRRDLLRLAIARPTPPGNVVSWQGVLGHSYTLEWISSPTQPWSSVSNSLEFLGNDQGLSYTNNNPDKFRLYRLIVQEDL